MKQNEKDFLFAAVILVILVAIATADVFWLIDGMYSHTSDAQFRWLINFIPGLFVWWFWGVTVIVFASSMLDEIPLHVKKNKVLIGSVGTLIVGYYMFFDAWISVRLAFAAGQIGAVLQTYMAPFGFLLTEILPLSIGIVLLIIVVMVARKNK